MIKALSATGIALCLAVPAFAGTPDEERAAVKKAVEGVSYATTIKEGLSYFAPGIVQDDFFGPQRRGVPEVRKNFDVYMASYTGFKAQILSIDVEVDGNLAISASHQSFKAKGINGTPDLDAIIRQTDVLKKINGKWLITYEHLSVPVDLKTGLAVWKPLP